MPISSDAKGSKPEIGIDRDIHVVECGANKNKSVEPALIQNARRVRLFSFLTG